MRERVQKPVPKEREQAQPQRAEDLSEAKADLDGEMDEILDEIDEVLEENAEAFVSQFRQKGGEVIAWPVVLWMLIGAVHAAGWL